MGFLNIVLPLGSAVLSFVFAVMVFDQWLQRRHSFQLVWAIGLVWYGIAAGCEFVGGAFGWSGLTTSACGRPIGLTASLAPSWPRSIRPRSASTP